MSDNETSLEAMAEEAKKVIDDSEDQKDHAGTQPGMPTVAKENAFTPWDKVGFITIGPKGVYIAPKGSGYPKPTQEPPKEPEMKKEEKSAEAGATTAGKLTPEEAIRTLEEKVASLEAKMADLAKPKDQKMPEDEEMMKKKAPCASEGTEAKQESPKAEPVPPKAQEPPKEGADHSAASPWSSTLAGLRKNKRL